MADWYNAVILESGRQPLFLMLVAFVLTFVITRIITRLIRAGIGPLRNISAAGIHVHHVVPGIIAMMAGGLIGFGASRSWWVEFGAVVFGIGSALVLDEFAMILRLEDVYWEHEGRLSADVVLIGSAVMACALVIAAPQDPPGPDETDPYVRIAGPITFVLIHILPIAITVLKGKVFAASVSLVFIVPAWICAIRLAKPNSPWSIFFYGRSPKKKEEAIIRAERSARRWRPVRLWLHDHLFGFADLAKKPNSVAADDEKG